MLWHYLVQVKIPVTEVKPLARCCICKFCYLSSTLQSSDMCNLDKFFLIMRIKVIIAHYTTQWMTTLKELWVKNRSEHSTFYRKTGY
jgi:hypothetical protein